MVKKITPVLQARIGSTRLPGKVLKPICGESMLSHIVRRLLLAEGLEPMVVATTTNPADDLIESECACLGVKCYRGSESDVLSRFYEAAVDCGAGHIMRICCDNPLLDPKILSRLAIFYRKHSFSYVSYKKIPLGLGSEIFTFERLEDAYQYGKKPYHREHVTPFIYENGVGCGHLIHEPDLSHLRFTIDTPEDFSFITIIYETLYHNSTEFGLDEVLALLHSRPELLEINRRVKQRSYNSAVQ